jgi:hypothetical protein
MAVTTRYKLQSGIIWVQSAMLRMYEEGVLEGGHSRHSVEKHMHRLLHTTRSARHSAINALATQHTRMLADLAEEKARSAREPSLRLPGAYPAPTPPLPPVPRSHLSPPRSTSSASGNGTGAAKQNHLFCIYARDLQSTPHLPLSDNFKPAGDHRCPYCSAHIAARLSMAWEIPKRSGKSGNVVRKFFVGTRFLVKSHREGGGYACVLCREYREADTVCGDVRSLVEHLWKEHGESELEWDDDVGEG